MTNFFDAPPSLLRRSWRAAVSSAGRGAISRSGVDQATAFGVLSRLAQLLAGAVSLVMIGRYLDPVQQGYYYTFGSIVALQSFIELGLATVLVNFASHEWAHLRLDATGRLTGRDDALSRLVSLGRFAFKWYGYASLVFIVVVGLAGTHFLAGGDAEPATWRLQWLTLIVLSAGALFLMPLDSLLEGSGQIATVYRSRLLQAVLGNAVVWLALLLGAGLWAAPVWVATNLARALSLAAIRYRRFFQAFLQRPQSPGLHWWSDVWPMQWRLAASGLVNYFGSALYTPIMFHYHGPAVAGRMGMTWTLALGVQSMGIIWLYSQTPKFGALISKRDFETLDTHWFRTTVGSVSVLALASVAVLLCTWALQVLDVSLAERLLGLQATALLLSGMVVAQLGQAYAVYLRAHRREPLLVLSVVTGLLTAVLVWAFGSRFGPIGATAAYFAVVSVVTVPWGTAIWWRCRRAWHGGSEPPARDQVQAQRSSRIDVPPLGADSLREAPSGN